MSEENHLPYPPHLPYPRYLPAFVRDLAIEIRRVVRERGHDDGRLLDVFFVHALVRVHVRVVRA